jgi:hypothetical protein
MIKLIFYCGKFSESIACLNPTVIGQTTQSSIEIFNTGFNYNLSDSCIVDTVFSNIDHFLYGLQVAVKFGKIKSENILILHHSENDIVTKLGINKSGSCRTEDDKNPPKDFFDMADRALDVLIGLSETLEL